MEQKLRRVVRVVVPLLGLAPWMACSSTDESGGATGGLSATGGIASGSGGAAGRPGTGGVAPSTGGTVSSFGGSIATGGASPTGGVVGGAGKASTGGSATTGGNGNSGGAKATGGSSSAGAPSGGSSTGGAGATGTGGGTGGGMAKSAGCGKATTLKSGRTSIEVGSAMREYVLALPDDYDQSRPYRLIFGWHPLGGSADQVSRGGYYGLESKSEGSAIFVAPEGLPFSGSSLGWGNQNGADIDFLEAMLARFRAELCIDENRIFSTGFSFGGMFSFASGCSPNGMMRAVAPQAGNTVVSRCEAGTRPVALMGFHGTEDTVVGIDGGRDGRDIFIERNGCTETSMELASGWCDEVGQQYQPCTCVSYQGCTDGYPVIWCEFNGPHTPAPNSSTTIWNFFAQF
jgi:poly(3-hydroxybutyrate) depolymerase